jgi:hypothetical protein
MFSSHLFPAKALLYWIAPSVLERVVLVVLVVLLVNAPHALAHVAQKSSARHQHFAHHAHLVLAHHAHSQIFAVLRRRQQMVVYARILRHWTYKDLGRKQTYKDNSHYYNFI